MAGQTDFYEEDEPADKIHAAFERGQKGVTALPRCVIRDLKTQTGDHGVYISAGRKVSAVNSRYGSAG